jgi:hypothetical protein
MTFMKEQPPAVAGVSWFLFRRSLIRRSLNGDRRDIFQHPLLDLIELPIPLH